MSTLKQRIARRVKNAELTQKDAANRCHICKRSLLDVSPTYEAVGAERRIFCSRECRDEFLGVGR